MNIRIVLADDHKITREGLTAMLNGQPNMEVVGEADNGRSAVALVRQMAPDVVIMDVTMPDMNGIEATQKVRDESRKTKVIALSMHSDKRFVKGMFEAGASAYLLKDGAFEDLVRAIHAVINNQAYVSPGITSLILEGFVTPRGSESSKSSVLSPREREVLQLIAEGMSTKDIAHHLGRSVKTVESHRRHIMESLGLHTVAELTKFAIREGLTQLES